MTRWVGHVFGAAAWVLLLPAAAAETALPLLLPLGWPGVGGMLGMGLGGQQLTAAAWGQVGQSTHMIRAGIFNALASMCRDHFVLPLLFKYGTATDV